MLEVGFQDGLGVTDGFDERALMRPELDQTALRKSNSGDSDCFSRRQLELLEHPTRQNCLAGLRFELQDTGKHTSSSEGADLELQRVDQIEGRHLPKAFCGQQDASAFIDDVPPTLRKGARVRGEVLSVDVNPRKLPTLLSKA
jgi:hypothetical protein